MSEEIIIGWIPDQHCKPGISNERFEAAANYFIEKGVTDIINLGDGPDMPSLSHFDDGKKAMEGRRYEYDIEAFRDALNIFHATIDNYNRTRKRKFLPNLEYVEGNHDNRIRKAIEANAKFDLTISIDDIGVKEYGWNVTPFGERLQRHGFVVTHYFPSGNMGRPISGANIGQSIYNKYSCAGIQGHTHLFQVAINTTGEGRKLLSGTLGWFPAIGQREDYAKNVDHTWWPGLTIFRNVKDGFADIETISLERLMREYR